ncbi:isoleucine--tRNA ligase [Longivirga aurantiaca]|uniref:Isoleucine--tRNA ligase n=1 Tax=Longivirga aurantiaca TaxID=1837743 RepID=A0ABW1T3T8_9ACTN
MYRPVPPQVDLAAVDHEVLAFWRDHDVFDRSLAQSEGRPLWVFNEGPPTANGMPGTHHVEARVFKDVFPRYRTMKGYHVPRKAGWDCHGLPVELAVEKELGFSGKKDIEAFGIAEFNATCRESVLRHVGAFADLTERMGYWVDMGDAYWTMDPQYVESVWWSLKQIFDKGLLVQDHRVSPYCPRCGTGLSDHELAQGYETVVDPSVYVRFPVTGGPVAEAVEGAALLIWTTTPWTLVSNTAVAVHPTVDYVAARTADGETLVVAEPLLAQLGDGAEVVARWTGTELAGTTYSRPFDLVDIPDAHYVVTADYVTTEDGSGLVHLAPAFGADDLLVGRANGLPVVNPVRPDGTFEEGIPLVGGMFFKKADAPLVDDLQARGLLFKHVPYEHAYPHCWRCHTPLVYYAQPSWYIRTTAVKDALLRENEGTDWHPRTIQWGRYGDWLHNNIDWALSRSRYWGTPLPIWRCDAGHLTCVESLADLGSRAGQELSSLDPHRPFVDDVTFPCSDCDGTMTRVPEVIDAWYDSGAMPFAQFGYPHTGQQEFADRYPADFICEAIDQTRGWFYTLMAVGTLVFDRSSYKTVLCLGHILDEEGRKMSKHLGNVLEPIPLMDEHGADAVRWFMLAGGSPWQARRVGHGTIQEVVRKTLLTYWNTVSFQALYARESGFEPTTTAAPPAAERPALDRWALSEAHRLARDVDAALESYDTQKAGRLLSAYVDDLSNWYVRRSRRRFWAGDPSALATLHECLYVVTLLMAPFTPFITERVWQDLFASTSDELPDSVHLSAWPAVDGALVDDDLAVQMATVRRLVELGRAARATSGVRTRQPLGRALVASPGWDRLSPALRAEVSEELNCGDLLPLGEMAGHLVDVSVKANFRALGKRFGKGTPPVAEAIAAADAAALVASLRSSGSAGVVVDGEDVSLTEEDVVITETPVQGWAVASDGGETVALDLELTPELRRAGLARESVRLVQDARKSSGFAVSDRIDLWWVATDDELGEALREHGSTVADEVLATCFTEGEPAEAAGLFAGEDLELGLRFWVRTV